MDVTCGEVISPSGFSGIRLFRIMSIPTMFHLFLVLTSEMLGRLLPVTTSTYHSRRHGRLYFVIWRRQENSRVNAGIRYSTVCLITKIYQDI